MSGIVILTGASGSGKTAIADAIGARDPTIEIVHFDRIGVPTTAEMIAAYGSPEGWQSAMTMKWLEDLAGRRSDGDVLLEGQMRIAFVTAAAERAGVTDYRLVLIDCDDVTRAARLAGRGEGGLAGGEMMRWAAYLRDEAWAAGVPVIDTSGEAVARSAERTLRLVEERPAP